MNDAILVKVKDSGRARNEGLDQLRGLLAFTVMLYHLVSWCKVTLNPFWGNALDLAGVYFVSTFYVLSGTAMLIAYGPRPFSQETMIDFAVRRIFRIMPMFWLVTAFAFINMCVGIIPFPQIFYPANILLNLSGLFSWIRPHAYFSAGMWSIGNELAFYTIFPLFLRGLRSPRLFTTACIAVIVGSFAWTEAHLNGGTKLVDQWRLYINPLNQIGFFMAGLLLGRLVIVRRMMTEKTHILIFCIGLAVFLIISVFVDKNDSVTGFSKQVLFADCLLLCLGAVGTAASGQAGRVLKVLGQLSYSLYLLHWPVYLWVSSMSAELGGGWKILIVATATSALSYISFYAIEKPCMEFGAMCSRWLRAMCPSRTVTLRTETQSS